MTLFIYLAQRLVKINRLDIQNHDGRINSDQPVGKVEEVLT